MPVPTSRSARALRCAGAGALVAVALTGCQLSSSAGGPPASAADPLAAPTPSPSPSESALFRPDATPTDPAQTLARWTDQAQATAGVESFLAELAQASAYEVRRVEEVHLFEESLTATLVHIVDEDAARVDSSLSFAASDEVMWGEISSDPAEIERLHTLTITTVIDYVPATPRAFMTYTGSGGWDGKWLDLGALPGTPGQPLRTSSPEIYAGPLREVLELEPTGFEPEGFLRYDVPADIAASFVPPRTALSLQEAGVDLFDLDVTAAATVYPVVGGVEVAIDVAWLLRETVDLVDDATLADYMGTVSLPVTLAVSDLDLVEPVTLPAADAIVTEPPTS